jgi:hypothetical protein
MKGITTYGQLTYFDTKEQELQVTTLQGDTITFDMDSDIELPEDTDFDNLMGKDVGVMEIDGIAIKIIWQGNRPY